MPGTELLAGFGAAIVGAGIGRLTFSSPLCRSSSRTAVVVVGSAVVALTSDTHATGRSGTDLAWRFFLVLAFSGAAKRTKQTSLVIVATVATIATVSGVSWVGFAAIGVAIVGTTSTASALVGVLVGATTLHAEWPGGAGRTAVLTAVLLLALVATTDRRFAGQAVLIALAVAGACGAITAIAGVGLLGQRLDARAAVDAGQAGLDAARAGRSTEAAAHFADAERKLHGVRSAMQGWLIAPARAVPIVGANLADADALLEVARAIAASGVATASAADVDHVQPRDGAIDLAALRSFAPPLRQLDAALTQASRSLAAIGSTWTVGPIRTRAADLTSRVTRAQRDARRARRTVEAVPAMLGGDGVRRYFLAVMTPSELRGGGGFIGNWGIIEARDGRISLPRFARITDLYREEPYRITVDPEYEKRYVDYFKLRTFPQNLLASPDLPANAVAIRQILQQAGEGDVDGIIAVDPIAMAALLQLTGPIDVEGWGAPLDSENVAEILLYRQYEHADDPRRPELLARTTQALFRRLTTGSLPSAATVARTLGPAVAAGHLQFASLHEGDHHVLQDAGLEHALPEPKGADILVLSQNEAPSKLDWFLRRKIAYRLDVDEHGNATGTVTVELRNTARATGLPPTYFQYVAGGLAPGVDVQDVSLYTPLHATEVTVDGKPVEFNTWTERGWKVYDRFVVVAPGAMSVVVFQIQGSVGVVFNRVEVRPQPTVVPDELTVVVNGRRLFDQPLKKALSASVRPR